jgi:hypothetical protein
MVKSYEEVCRSLPSIEGTLTQRELLEKAGWRMNDDFMWTRRRAFDEPMHLKDYVGCATHRDVFIGNAQDAVNYEVGNYDGLLE